MHLAKDVYHINTSSQIIEKYQLPDPEEPKNFRFDFLYFSFHNGRIIFLMPTPAQQPSIGRNIFDKEIRRRESYMYLGFLSKDEANNKFFENAISQMEYYHRTRWGLIPRSSWFVPNFQLEKGEFLDYRAAESGRRLRTVRGAEFEVGKKAKLYKTKIEDFISATHICSCQGKCKDTGVEFTHHGVTKKMKVFSTSKVQSKITLMNLVQPKCKNFTTNALAILMRKETRNSRHRALKLHK